MRLVIFITVFFAVAALGFSATLNVPADYKSIQLAIDAAATGDTVLVAPGTYVESIDFSGKAITVQSSDGPELTVISWNTTGEVVRFENSEGLDSVLQGFTITAGFGIRCFGASPTITGNIIEGCLSYGVACVQYAAPAIVGNTISNCWQGINCDLNASPTIMNNVIKDNDSVPGPDQGGTRGGGIFANEFCSPMIVNNVIYGNSVYGGFNFLGWWLPGAGGGIYSAGPALIANNTIYGNMAEDKGGEGGGVYGVKSTTIVNSIIRSNLAEAGFQISGGPAVTYSDVQGGWAGTGNIDLDPLFVDLPGGDFHLTYPSPCRDAGDNLGAADKMDFEGDPRIAHGTVDMGADEFYTHLYVTGKKTPGGAIQGKLVGLPATTPVGLFIGTGLLPSPMNTMWGEFHLAPPWFLFGPFGPMPASGVMVLATTLPASPPGPYDIPMQALIGLTPDSLTNLYVLEVR